MPRKVFQPSEHKEEIIQQLRDGKTIDELKELYGQQVSERTLYRYHNEVQDELSGKTPDTKKTTPLKMTATGVGKEAFAPSGAAAPPPPGSPPGEYINLGTFRLPLEDWGYSSALNLLVVAATFDQARKEYDYPKTMKVGDFLANLCQAFRMLKGWDTIGMSLISEENQEVVTK